MSIDIGGATVDRQSYVAGTFKVTDAAGLTLHEGALELRGRGNSTWGMDKKPYRVRLNSGAALMGMPSNRHWVLLANHADKTLLRNDLTFEIGRLLDMAWTPRSRDVHVRLDGRYDGVYQLTEHIRIGTDRVDIDSLTAADTSEPQISGGYLLQIDEVAAGSAACFPTARAAMTICGEDPDPLNDPARVAQRNYIVDYVEKAESALYSNAFTDPQTGYAAYLDVDSVIQYYLASELVRNVDGNLRRSTYLFKPRNGKLHFGPLWDFDLALGNVTYDNATQTQGWYIRTAPWYARLFEDPQFASRVAQKWRDLKSQGTLDAIVAYLDRRAVEMSDTQVQNFTRWPILDDNIFFNVSWPVPNSYDNEIAYLRGFLVARIAWMDGQLNPP